MRTFPRLVCLLLSFLPLGLHAQYPNSGYVPLVPTTTGASVGPVVPVEMLPDIPLPPQRIPHTAHVPPFNDSQNPIQEEEKMSFSLRTSMAPERAQQILNFWFGDLSSPDVFPENKVPVWFASSPEIDRQILDNYSQDITMAMRGEYNNWRSTPAGRLALILLLDQFPRHIYRNRPQAYMFDRMARALVLEGLQKGDDKRLYPVERAFFYLPLEHSEDIEMQNLSVSKYQNLLRESPPPIRAQIDLFLRSALMHRQQIDRFDRFPHRNAILGRESTPEEVVFLNQWGTPSF